MYTLLVTHGPDAGLSHRIRASRVSVGTSADMNLVLTDPTVKPHHFIVIFEEGGWKAITYEPQTMVLIDRRWQHPLTRQRGARIFVGESQILLFAGEIDLDTAKLGDQGLDMDAETLRDDALTQVKDQAYKFRHDMLGKAQPVTKSEPKILPIPDAAGEEVTLVPPENPHLGILAGNSGAAVMQIPETIARGRAEKPPPPQDRPDRQSILLTDTGIKAMPSASRDLVVLYDHDGAFASEVRILATRIEELRSRYGYKSFLVTSVGDGDGKTVLSNNLALAMSEDSDRKVALVDANFRSPRAGRLFNLDPSRGLLAAISGERPLSQCVARVVGRNLVILHAGGEHKNPASILSSPKFKTLLSELYQAVDFMIVDAPSAIPYADVPLLVNHVDAVLLVVASDRTERVKLDKAMQTIGRGRIAGSVFVHRTGRLGRTGRREA